MCLYCGVETRGSWELTDWPASQNRAPSSVRGYVSSQLGGWWRKTTVVLFWPLHAYAWVQELKNSHAFSQNMHTKGSWGSSWKELTFFSFIVSESWFPGEYTWQSQPCRCALGFFRPKGWVSPSPRSHFTEGNTGSNLAHWILGMVTPDLVVCIWLPDSTHFEE